MEGIDGSRGFRISEEDRERAAQHLQVAMAEGRISMAELDERLTVVYAARYADDLAAPLADLPAADHPVVGWTGQVDEPVVLRSGMGDIKRRGQWRVPSRLRVHSPVGSVVLDFCDTEVPHPVVDVELHLGMGSARILVPDGATADVDGVSATMGSARARVPAGPRAGVPHFRVHGTAGMGSVVVRHRRRFGGFRC